MNTAQILLTAVLVAGGSGIRMGGDRPKQFQELNKQPVLVHTLRRLLEYDPQLVVALVLNKEHWHYWVRYGLPHFKEEDRLRILPVSGGEKRTLSVLKGLQALEMMFQLQPTRGTASCVAIHDGVRPLVLADLIDRCYTTAQQKGAAVAAVPVKSSLRQMTADGGSLAVDRAQFYEVQTPQTFRFYKLLEAYNNRPHDDFTDDASLMEAVFPEQEIQIVLGSYDNLKITTPEDLAMARFLLKAAPTRESKKR